MHFASLQSELTFEPVAPDAVFEVKDVVIGVDFHWERRENQKFAGALCLKPMADGRITVINRIAVEDYLRSVISSEMSATSSPELLRAHAVISRFLRRYARMSVSRLPERPIARAPSPTMR